MSYTKWYGGEREQAWRTPLELFEMLHKRFRFTLDGAASKENALLPKFSTAEAPVNWKRQRVFCNPPWSSIPEFIELAAEANLAVLLVPARVNSRWFHRALDLGANVECFRQRPKFVGAPSSTPVDCILLVFQK